MTDEEISNYVKYGGPPMTTTVGTAITIFSKYSKLGERVMLLMLNWDPMETVSPVVLYRELSFDEPDASQYITRGWPGKLFPDDKGFGGFSIFFPTLGMDQFQWIVQHIDHYGNSNRISDYRKLAVH